MQAPPPARVPIPQNMSTKPEDCPHCLADRDPQHPRRCRRCGAQDVPGPQQPALGPLAEASAARRRQIGPDSMVQGGSRGMIRGR